MDQAAGVQHPEVYPGPVLEQDWGPTEASSGFPREARNLNFYVDSDLFVLKIHIYLTYIYM